MKHATHSSAASAYHNPARYVLDDRMLSRIDAFIHDNLHMEIGVKDLAEIARRPASTFSRAFKAATGKTPYDFIIDRRVHYAVKVLRESQLTLAEVAMDAGFSSQSHMTTTFSNRLGFTPRHCRMGAR